MRRFGIKNPFRHFQSEQESIGRLKDLCAKRLDFNRLNRASPVTVVTASCNYIELLENWMEWAVDKLEGNLVVVALDSEVHERLGQDYVSIRMDWSGEVGQIWSIRLAVVISLVEAGFDVVHSDLDAIWCGDPLDYLSQLEEDLVFSQGTVWPQEVFEQTGMVLCCGFYLVRSSEHTMSFLRDWAMAMEVSARNFRKFPDDQSVLNNLIIAHGFRITFEADYELVYDGKRFSCFFDPVEFSSNKHLKCCVLPHQKFQRIPERQLPVVAHYLSGKDGDSSKAVLIQHGLWKK